MFEPLIDSIDEQINIVDGFIKVAKDRDKKMSAFMLEDIKLSLIKSRHDVVSAQDQAEQVHKFEEKMRSKALTLPN